MPNFFQSDFVQNMSPYSKLLGKLRYDKFELMKRSFESQMNLHENLCIKCICHSSSVTKQCIRQQSEENCLLTQTPTKSG